MRNFPLLVLPKAEIPFYPSPPCRVDFLGSTCQVLSQRDTGKESDIKFAGDMQSKWGSSKLCHSQVTSAY